MDDMLGCIIHKKQVQAQIPATHYGRDWGARRKLHTWTKYENTVYQLWAFIWSRLSDRRVYSINKNKLMLFHLLLPKSYISLIGLHKANCVLPLGVFPWKARRTNTTNQTRFQKHWDIDLTNSWYLSCTIYMVHIFKVRSDRQQNPHR